MKSIRCPVLWILLAACVAMPACTIVKSSSLLVGQKRAPIDPATVRVYYKAPTSYEEIAIISAKAGHDFKSDQSLMDSAVQRLKEEAAKVGANGVLLESLKERSNPTTTTSFGSATAVGTEGSVSATGIATSVNRGDAYTGLRGVAIFVKAEDSQ